MPQQWARPLPCWTCMSAPGSGLLQPMTGFCSPTRAHPHFSGFTYHLMAWISKLLHISCNIVDLILVTFYSNPSSYYLIALLYFLDFFIHHLSHSFHSFLRRVVADCLLWTSLWTKCTVPVKTVAYSNFSLRYSIFLILKSHTSLEKTWANIEQPEWQARSPHIDSPGPLQTPASRLRCLWWTAVHKQHAGVSICFILQHLFFRFLEGKTTLSKFAVQQLLYEIMKFCFPPKK